MENFDEIDLLIVGAGKWLCNGVYFFPINTHGSTQAFMA
jgi:hypothetical protein